MLNPDQKPRSRMSGSTGGAVWSVAYEYFQGYRFASGPGFRLVEI